MRRSDALRLEPGRLVRWKKGASWNRRPMKIHAAIFDTEDLRGSPRFVLIDPGDAQSVPTQPISYLLLEKV